MKTKKLLSLMLCFAMLVTTVLTSCSDEKDDEEKAASGNVELTTLNMFITTDEATTDEQKQAVEIAINEITIKELKTKVNINFLTEDEMWPAVEKTLEDIETYEENKKAQKKQNSQNKQAKTKKQKEAEKPKSLSLDQIYTDMRLNGINIDSNVPQIDIIVFNDYNKYYEYVFPGLDEKGRSISTKLAPLDGYLKNESKVLSSYIYPIYFEAAKLGGKKPYGIPVNGPVGTYEYIAIDRELALKYIANANMLQPGDFETTEEYDTYFDNYVTENFNTIAKLDSFLKAVKASEKNIVPLNKTTSPANVEFYLEEGSPLGVIFEGVEWSDRLYSVYDDPSVKEHYEAIYNYRQAGYIADETTSPDARFAVQIIEGSITAEETLEAQDERDYIFIKHKQPTFSNESALSGVFSISAKSLNKDKAMKLIEAFNTNPDLANLLQWGIEDGKSTYKPEGSDEFTEGSYKLDSEKAVILINDGNGYKMDNNVTGNKYIKYRLSGTPDDFEEQKLQNSEAVIGAFLGYSPVYNDNDEEDKKVKDEILSTVKIAREYYPDFLAGTGDRPFEERYNELLSKLSEINPFLAFDTHVWYNYSGPYAQYVGAMKETYPYGRKYGLVVPSESTEETTQADITTEVNDITDVLETTDVIAE
ncbi:MAG: hypothetical protein IKI97_06825 [Clostridia bacterium]|nr:hypothetical protein [Clostridia bacterium]